MDKKKLPLFNPLADDFVAQMRDENNQLHPVIMPPREISYFEQPVYEHMRKHLAMKIYFIEGNPRKDRDLELAKIYERIEVKDGLT